MTPEERAKRKEAALWVHPSFLDYISDGSLRQEPGYGTKGGGIENATCSEEVKHVQAKIRCKAHVS